MDDSIIRENLPFETDEASADYDFAVVPETSQEDDNDDLERIGRIIRESAQFI